MTLASYGIQAQACIGHWAQTKGFAIRNWRCLVWGTHWHFQESSVCSLCVGVQYGDVSSGFHLGVQAREYSWGSLV